MKKIAIIFTAVLSVLLVSCKQAEELPQLEITAANTLFNYAGGEGNIQYNSSSTVTSASSNADWIVASVRKSDVLLVVAENAEIASRTATVTLKNEEGITADITIDQKAAKFKFEGNDINFDSNSSEAEMEYYALDKMVVVIPEAAQSWLSAVIYSDKLELVAEENLVVNSRSTTVSYAIASKTGTFKVTQAAAPAYIRNFNPQDIEAPSKGMEVSYTYNTNSALSATASDSWITAKVANNALTITVAQNYIDEPREGKVDWAVAKSDIKGTIVVKQEKGFVVRSLELKDSEGEKLSQIETDWTGGSQTITVYTNTPWTVSSTADWVKVSPASGTNKPIEPENQTVTITIDPMSKDADGNDRVAEITFTGNDVEDGPAVLKVSQSGFTKIGIALSNISYNSVDATFTPSNDETMYIYGVAEKDGYSDADVVSTNYSEIMALAEQYSSSYSLAELLEIILPVGDNEGTLDKLDESTEYVIYAYEVDLELNVLGPVFTEEFKTIANPWKYVGVGKYTEGFLSGLFSSLDAKTVEVDIYESKAYPGLYAMDTPYGPEMIGNWFYNAAPSVLANYEGTYWKQVMFEINAINPNQVYMMIQELGMYSSSYGWMGGGNAAVQSNGSVGLYSVGTLASGKITFPTKGLRVKLGSSLYYGNYNGTFCVELPTSTAPAAMSKSSTAKKMNRFERIAFSATHPIKTVNLQEPGWSVRAE